MFYYYAEAPKRRLCLYFSILTYLDLLMYHCSTLVLIVISVDTHYHSILLPFSLGVYSVWCSIVFCFNFIMQGKCVNYLDDLVNQSSGLRGEIYTSCKSVTNFTSTVKLLIFTRSGPKIYAVFHC